MGEGEIKGEGFVAQRPMSVLLEGQKPNETTANFLKRKRKEQQSERDGTRTDASSSSERIVEDGVWLSSDESDKLIADLRNAKKVNNESGTGGKTRADTEADKRARRAEVLLDAATKVAQDAVRQAEIKMSADEEYAKFVREESERIRAQEANKIPLDERIDKFKKDNPDIFRAVVIALGVEVAGELLEAAFKKGVPLFRELQDRIKSSPKNEVLKEARKGVLDAIKGKTNTMGPTTKGEVARILRNEEVLLRTFIKNAESAGSKFRSDDEAWALLRGSSTTGIRDPGEVAIQDLDRLKDRHKDMLEEEDLEAKEATEQYFEGIKFNLNVSNLKAEWAFLNSHEATKADAAALKTVIDRLEAVQLQNTKTWGDLSSLASNLALGDLTKSHIRWYKFYGPNAEQFKSERDNPPKAIPAAEAQGAERIPVEVEARRDWMRGRLRILETTVAPLVGVPETDLQIAALRKSAENFPKELKSELEARLTVWLMQAAVDNNRRDPSKTIDALGQLAGSQYEFSNDVVRLLLEKDKLKGMKINEAWNILQKYNSKGGEAYLEDFSGDPNSPFDVSKKTGYYWDRNVERKQLAEAKIIRDIAGSDDEKSLELAADSLRIAEFLAVASGESSVWYTAAAAGATNDKLASATHLAEHRKSARNQSKRFGPDVTIVSVKSMTTSYFRQIALGAKEMTDVNLTDVSTVAEIKVAKSNCDPIEADLLLSRLDKMANKYEYRLEYWGSYIPKAMGLMDVIMKEQWKPDEVMNNWVEWNNWLGKVDKNGSLELKKAMVCGILGQLRDVNVWVTGGWDRLKYDAVRRDWNARGNVSNGEVNDYLQLLRHVGLDVEGDYARNDRYVDKIKTPTAKKAAKQFFGGLWDELKKTIPKNW